MPELPSAGRGGSVRPWAGSAAVGLRRDGLRRSCAGMAERNKSILGRSLALLQRFRGMGWDGRQLQEEQPGCPSPK